MRGLINSKALLAAIFAVGVSFMAGNVMAQQVILSPLTSHEVNLSYDSGPLYNFTDEPRLLWTQVITVKEAEWLRLEFDSLALGDDGLGGPSSTLRITSLEDNAYQMLNAKSAREWRNTSAYFNGNALRIELIAWPNGKLNQVVIDAAIAGDPPQGGVDLTICDSVDDRLLSDDPRAGRGLPIGCTSWLFDGRKNCMLTAGHCVGGTDVVEFNVPLSDANGSINFADPDDQYAADPTSKQGTANGIGEDWGYFGCFNNSNTGLSPLEAQGDSYQLQLPPPVNSDDDIRITGYGTTSSPVDPQWNQVQKTQVGPYWVFSGTQLGYRTDTTGGNSGSPVIFENDGAAIGIHTHGGCGSNGSGSNSGTGANHPNLQNALANPLGICQSSLGFDFPNGRPANIDPAGGTTMRVVVFDDGEEPQPGTGVLHYDDGNGFQAIAMNVISDNVYDAVFPAVDCGLIVKYYVSAQSVDDQQFTSPAAAPTAFYSATSAQAVTVSFEDNFQSDQGWTVTGNALDGQWERGIPAGGGDRGDPANDADGSGACYVTDNEDGNSDVDGGSTILTSPIMDATASAEDEVILSYYRWYSNDFGGDPMNDIFAVEISNDGGSNWTALETVGPTGPEVSGGWFFKSFNVRDFVTLSDQMRIRFNASDLGDGSVIEAGVDGVQIQVLDCGGGNVEVIAADTFSALRGILVSGSLADTFDSDDSYLKYNPGLTLNSSEPPVWLIFEGSLSSDNPASLDITLEASANTVGLSQTIEMFNWNTNQYEQVDARAASLNTDSITTVDLSGNISDYVQSPAGTVKARLGWRVTGLVFVYPWTVCIDQVVWTATN